MIKAMYVLKGSKEALAVLLLLMLLKSKELKVMFAAFMQHCIQSTVILLNLLLMSKGSKVTNTLYTGPLTPPMGKAIYL